MYHQIISGKDSDKRRKHMKEQFKELRMEPQFFDAIMGRDISEEELDSLVAMPTFLTKGEIGCALSHLAIYEKLLDSNEAAVLIFEDDAIFSEMITKEVLEGFYDFIAKKQEPSILTLHDTEIGYKVVDVICQIPIIETPRFMCATGYVINRKAAENLLKVQQPLKFELDQFRLYYFLGLTNLYAASINLIKTSDEEYPSIIGHQERWREEGRRKTLRKRYFRKIVNKFSIKDRLNYYIRRIQKHRAQACHKL